MSGTDVAVEGGSLAVGLFAVLLALATIAVGAWIAVSAYRGYRQSGERSVLFLAVGIALASTVHTSARFVVPTVTDSAVLTDAVAVASQLAGLVLILVAIYGRPERHGRRAVSTALAGGVLALLFPVVLLDGVGSDPTTVQVVLNAVPAIVGSFVAVQAYRGYRRYDRPGMRLLAVGIATLTVGSFGTILALHALSPAADATALVAIGLVELVGLLAILRSLTRT